MQDCLLWQWEEILPGGAGRYERMMLAIRKLRDLAEAAREARCYIEAQIQAPALAETKKEP